MSAGVEAPLVRQFDLLATAPGGVARLRELILTLAVQGKLVPQEAGDEPAGVLLQRIRAEKDRLIEAKAIRRDKPISTLTEDEYPFEIPFSWEWVPLQHLGYTQTGTTPDKNNPHLYGNDIPFIKPGDIHPSHVEYKNEGLSITGSKESQRLAPAGSVLMVCIGTIGKSGVIEKECSFNQQINSITPLHMIPHYVGWCLTSPYFQAESWARSSSTTIAIINKGKWESIPFPVPPLAEQSRIVTRVEELMRLCDALEQQRQLETAQHAQLLNTLLGTLTDCTSPDELAANWQRVSDHFDLLLDRPEAVDALEQTILQLAVRGLLVPQDPADEPASVLLQRIRAEKERLILAGKVKREKQSPEIPREAHPFLLPSNWTWARWHDVSLKIGDIDHKMPNEVSEGIPYVSPRDFYGTNEINFDGAKKISIADFMELSSKIKPERGDLIYPRYGTIGNVRMVNQDIDFLASYSCAVVKSFPRFVDPEFQYLFSMSECAKVQARQATNKTTQPNVGLKSIQMFCMPLPPQAEQTRIVARVTQLRDLCTTLRQRLAAGQTTQRHLAEALVEV